MARKKYRIMYRGQELLSPRLDLALKALLVADGDYELLASLLSCVLDLDLTPDDVTVTNSELVQAHEDAKFARVDVRVRLSAGQHVNVEIQIGNFFNMEKRSIFYASKLYTDQMHPKMDYALICPAIAINILDYNFLPFADYHNRYRLKNVKYDHELTDAFELNFLEVLKALKCMDGSMKSLWMRFVGAETEEELDMLAKENPIFEKARDKLIYISADEDLRYAIDMREKAEYDYWAGLATSEAKGRAEGETIGMAKGKSDVARNLLSMGMPFDKIVAATGLSNSEIEALQKGG